MKCQRCTNLPDKRVECDEWLLCSEDEARQLGLSISTLLKPGCVVYLSGPLGSGKTVLARAILQGLGNSHAVPSPTFALVYSYTLPAFSVHHFDLYRVNDPEELELIGIRDYFDGDSCCLIEWPERGEGLLPPADIDIQLSLAPVTVSSSGLASGFEQSRRVTITGSGHYSSITQHIAAQPGQDCARARQ